MSQALITKPTVWSVIIIGAAVGFAAICFADAKRPPPISSPRETDLAAQIRGLDDIIRRVENNLHSYERNVERMRPGVNQMSAHQTLFRLRQQLLELKRLRANLQGQLTNPSATARNAVPGPTSPTPREEGLADPRSVEWDTSALSRRFVILASGYDPSTGRVEWLLQSRTSIPFYQPWANFLDRDGAVLSRHVILPPMMIWNSGERVRAYLDLKQIGGLPRGTVRVVIVD